jgi:hypothetical protein
LGGLASQEWGGKHRRSALNTIFLSNLFEMFTVSGPMRLLPSDITVLVHLVMFAQ